MKLLPKIYNKLLTINHELEKAQGDDKIYWLLERNKLRMELCSRYVRIVERLSRRNHTITA